MIKLKCINSEKHNVSNYGTFTLFYQLDFRHHSVLIRVVQYRSVEHILTQVRSLPYSLEMIYGSNQLNIGLFPRF